MKHFATLACWGMVTLGSSALAADPVRLGKDEASALIVGKTIVYNGSNAQPLRVYFSSDGKLTGRTASGGQGRGGMSDGSWKMDDDGKICVTIRQGAMTDRCYYVMRSDAGLGISQNGDKPGQPITVE